MLFGVTRWAGAMRQPHLSVVAYDIACSRRAYRVRHVLAGLRCTGQYSVFELRMTVPQLRDLVAELTTLCDLGEDRLASWRPMEERVHVLDGHGNLLCRIGAGSECESSDRHGALLPAGGNYMVCYDIGDPDALIEIGRRVAARAAAVQRSVYWLRGSVEEVRDLVSHCASFVAAGDRFWIYPLASAAHLWRVQDRESCMLPVATYDWPAPTTVDRDRQ